MPGDAYIQTRNKNIQCQYLFITENLYKPEYIQGRNVILTSLLFYNVAM